MYGGRTHPIRNTESVGETVYAAGKKITVHYGVGESGF